MPIPLPDWLLSFLRSLRPGLPLYVTIAIVTGLCLTPWAKESDFLGAKEVRVALQPYFSIGFLFFSTLTVVTIGEILLPVLYRATVKQFGDWRRMRKFRRLDTTEKAVLIWCLQNHIPQFVAPLVAPLEVLNLIPAQALADKHLAEGSDLSDGRVRIYYINTVVWETLQRHRSEVRRSLPFTDATRVQVMQVLDQLRKFM